MLMFYTTLIDAPADQVRFESIYYGYRKQMYTVAFRILRNREDAEDAVQNALLGIARNMASVPASNEAVIRGYVLTAAKNAALSLLPQKQRQDEVLDIAEVCIASEEDLFQRLTESQDYAGIRRAAEKLPPPYREVILLVCVHERSVTAAADLLCRNRETVRKQLQRGRKLLIALCRKEGMEFGEEKTTCL